VSELMAVLDDVDAEAVAFPSLRPFASGGRGALMAMFGRADEARRLNDEAMRLGAELRGLVPPGLYESRSRTESLAGDHEAADRLIAEAVEWADRSDSVLERAARCLDEAEIHHLAVRDEQARVALDRARELFARKGATAGEALVDRHAAALGMG